MGSPAYRRKIAGEARAYVAAGWPVASGAWWDPAEDRYRCARAACVTEGLHPTTPHDTARPCSEVTAAQAATRDFGGVAARWDQRPYTVLLPTGEVCDVLELRGSAARRVRTVLAAHGRLGPVAASEDETVLLFTAVAHALDPRLTDDLARAGVLHHGKGSWVPLPASHLASGPMRWIHSPSAAGWRLPPLPLVGEALRVAAPPAGLRPTRAS